MDITLRGHDTPETDRNPQRVESGRLLIRRALLAAIGTFFVLYPALRPWQDETVLRWGSPLWIPSHLFAMLGFILLPAIPIMFAWHRSPGRRTLVAAAITLWLGVGLLLPYYGAEAFALHNIADLDSVDMVAASDAIRFGPIQGILFLLGLLLVAVGAVFTAVGLAQAHPWWFGAAFAAGFVLFGPQFGAPPAIRIAHGVLIAMGCVILALKPRASRRQIIAP